MPPPNAADPHRPSGPNAPKPRVAQPSASAPASVTPPTDAAKAAASGPPGDSLKTHMPAGEIGVRNAPGAVSSTASGGTSKAEDTSRTAGYVADLTQTNVPPPGPPIAKEPANFVGPEGIAPPPVRGTAKEPGPIPPLPDPAPIDPSPIGDPTRRTPDKPRDPSDPRPSPTPASPVKKPDREPPNPAAPVKRPPQF